MISTRNQMRSYMNELTKGPATATVSMTKLSLFMSEEKRDAYREVSDLSIADHLKAVDQLILTDNEATIARPILKEIKDRLTFLNNVGLNYLTLSRSAGTLSGGRKPAYSFGNPRSVPTSLVSFISWMSRLLASIKGTMTA